MYVNVIMIVQILQIVFINVKYIISTQNRYVMKWKNP